MRHPERDEDRPGPCRRALLPGEPELPASLRADSRAADPPVPDEDCVRADVKRLVTLLQEEGFQREAHPWRVSADSVYNQRYPSGARVQLDLRELEAVDVTASVAAEQHAGGGVVELSRVVERHSSQWLAQVSPERDGMIVLNQEPVTVGQPAYLAVARQPEARNHVSVW